MYVCSPLCSSSNRQEFGSILHPGVWVLANELLQAKGQVFGGPKFGSRACCWASGSRACRWPRKPRLLLGLGKPRLPLASKAALAVGPGSRACRWPREAALAVGLGSRACRWPREPRLLLASGAALAVGLGSRACCWPRKLRLLLALEAALAVGPGSRAACCWPRKPRLPGRRRAQVSFIGGERRDSDQRRPWIAVSTKAQQLQAKTQSLASALR
jgi:hypothetical protein